MIDSSHDNPSLVLMSSPLVPKDIKEFAIEQMNISGVKYRAIDGPRGPFACMELYLPSAIGFFIAAGFFNGFLQKAGADCYDSLKSAMQSVWRKSKKLEEVAIGSKGKVNPNNKYSLTYSITGEVAQGINFKFVIRTDISTEDADNGISAFLNLINEIHSGEVNKADLEALITHRPVGGTILVTFDASKAKIVAVDPLAN